jgi:hypothetical protein
LEWELAMEILNGIILQAIANTEQQELLQAPYQVNNVIGLEASISD